MKDKPTAAMKQIAIYDTRQKDLLLLYQFILTLIQAEPTADVQTACWLLPPSKHPAADPAADPAALGRSGGHRRDLHQVLSQSGDLRPAALPAAVTAVPFIFRRRQQSSSATAAAESRIG